MMMSNVNNISRICAAQQIVSSVIAVAAIFALRDAGVQWWGCITAGMLIMVAAGIGNALIIGMVLSPAKGTDITFEELTHSSKDERHQPLGLVGQVMLSIDSVGTVTYLSPAASLVFGIRDHDHVPKEKLDGFFLPRRQTGKSVVTSILESITKGQSYFMNVASFVNSNGKTFTAECRADPIVSQQEVIGAIIIIKDVVERERGAPQWNFRDYHDPVTGLPNRYFAQERYFQLSHSTQADVVFMYIDVDNIRTINDSLGYGIGNKVLATIGKRLQSLEPDVEIVACLGGDEFLIVMESARGADLAPMLQTLLAVIEQPMHVETYRISVTISVGVAVQSSRDEEFCSVLMAADNALCRAKAAGRNGWSFYTPEMGAYGLWRMQMQMDLRHAIDNQELAVYYQPQINVSTGAVVGAEALLRWRHPDRGYVAPSEFIPIAESCGLIISISNWVLQQVCKQIVAWRDGGLCIVPVSVNCSAAQFRQGNLMRDIHQALLAACLEPKYLELELTESILINDNDEVMDTIRELNALGVQLSIDDFGTGYSSLSYLKRLQVDKLKIDKSFIQNVLTDPKDAAIVETIVQLAHSLGMTAIAEGVENQETVCMLETMGCDQIQGFHYSKPVPAGEFEAFITPDSFIEGCAPSATSRYLSGHSQSS